MFVTTNNVEKAISIPPNVAGLGSSINGGELLFLSLATCFCNDIYREAATQDITVTKVLVEVSGHFGGIGVPATDIVYTAKLEGAATNQDLRQLILHTDRVSEVQNTLRSGVPVRVQSVN